MARPRPVPAAVTGACAVQAREAFEDPVTVVRGDSGPVVVDRQGDCAITVA
jgi:hypothetical protein